MRSLSCQVEPYSRVKSNEKLPSLVLAPATNARKSTQSVECFPAMWRRPLIWRFLLQETQCYFFPLVPFFCHLRLLQHLISTSSETIFPRVTVMSINPTSFSSAQFEKYKDVPALAPPSGVVPNFAAHNHHAVVLIILCSILLGIVYVFVCLRMYAKIWIKRTPGFDDGESPIGHLRIFL